MFHFQEWWEYQTIDVVNRWVISGSGTVLPILDNGRSCVNVNGPVGQTAILGSIIGFNVTPNFMAADNDKDNYIEKKLLVETSIIEHNVAGAGEWRLGLNEVNNAGVGADAIFIREIVGNTRSSIRDGGAQQNTDFTVAPNKVRFEIRQGRIMVYIGTTLVADWTAALPDDFMYLWFWANNNANVKLGPILSWYEKVELEA